MQTPLPPSPPFQDVITQVLASLRDQGAASKLVVTLFVVVAAWGVRRMVLGVVQRQIDDARTRYYVTKALGYVSIVLAILLIGTVWLSALTSLGTFLGLLTAGVAIALRDLIADLAGWLYILLRNPFEVGDRVEIGGQRGDVVDIRAFKFTLLEIGNWVDADQSTGRVIHIPNADVFRLPVANYTVEFPFVWNELPILVTFESNWRRAKELLLEIAQKRAGSAAQEAQSALRRTSRRFLIHYTKLTPAVFTSVRDSGVLLSVRYLCAPRHRRGTAQEIWEDTLDAFAQAPDIDWAYPTVRSFWNTVEGKPGTREELPARWTVSGDETAPPA